MTLLFLSKSTTPIIGWVAELLGWIMDLLFKFTNLFGIQNIGLCIILFTILVNVLMLPLTIKQQKSTKIMSIMQPELKAVQKKYEGKTDQASQQKMQAETQAVYQKYGTSMTGGCVQLLIQMPILFALYQVIYKIPGYVPSVYAILEPLAKEIQSIANFASYGGFGTIVEALKMTKLDFTELNNVIDFLYKLNPDQWVFLQDVFPSLSDLIAKTAATLAPMNSFLGINLATAPWQGLKPNWAWLIPLLAGASQWLSAKLMSVGQGNTMDDSNPAAGSMKTMNTVMPIMSVVFCFTFPAGIGIYWIASAVVRTIIQLIINAAYKDIDPETIVQQNLEKINKKRAKKGLPPKKIDDKAQQQAAREAAKAEYEEAKAQARYEKSQAKVAASTEYYNNVSNPNSLASKANMVAMFNQREEERRSGKKAKKHESQKTAAETTEAPAAQTAAVEASAAEVIAAESPATETQVAEATVNNDDSKETK